MVHTCGIILSLVLRTTGGAARNCLSAQQGGADSNSALSIRMKKRVALTLCIDWGERLLLAHHTPASVLFLV
jgi:hypothetical protein